MELRVLIVEDEARLADALAALLNNEKYLTDIARDGQEGLYFATSAAYDAIILDVMLPRMNGFEVADALRARKCTAPILMLTARDEVADKVRGLDCGADDYMTKPFSPDELLARLRALLRRPAEPVYEELAFGDLRLDLKGYQLLCGERSLRLSSREFELMRLLLMSPRAVVSKEELINRVWGTDSDAEDNNVEAYMSFLRKKLFFLRSAVQIITQRKVGYRLSEGQHDKAASTQVYSD